MALAGSHIRFAVEMKEKYQVGNVKQYITGAVYPDTRYTTRINRVLTHPKDYLHWDILKMDDFKKGWHSHLICDNIQIEVMKTKFPEQLQSGQIEFANDLWVFITAIKLLQDMDDVKQFDIRANFPESVFIQFPNKEDRQPVEYFYKCVTGTYDDLESLSLEVYISTFIAVGLPEEVANRVMKSAVAIQSDSGAIKRIHSMYAEIINLAQSRI